MQKKLLVVTVLFGITDSDFDAKKVAHCNRYLVVTRLYLQVGRGVHLVLLKAGKD